jgi:hypothetical protein
VASVVRDRDAPPPPKLGRPSGAVTALSPLAQAEAAPGKPPGKPIVRTSPAEAVSPLAGTEMAAVLAPIPHARDVAAPLPTSLGSEREPHQRSAAPLIIGLLALLAVGGGVYVATRGHATAPPNKDASIRALPIDALEPIAIADALVPPALPVDATAEADAAVLAPAPADAGTRHARPDAGHLALPADAATRSAPPDAPAEPAATGTGYVDITAAVYAQVAIDGTPAGPTPILHRALPAGRHTITFTAADSTNVVDKHITLSNGQRLRVTP